MDINYWKPMIKDESAAALEKNVELATSLGPEDYADLVMRMASRTLGTDEFSGLITSLVVGNVAFDVGAGVDIDLGDDFFLKVRVEKR